MSKLAFKMSKKEIIIFYTVPLFIVIILAILLYHIDFYPDKTTDENKYRRYWSTIKYDLVVFPKNLNNVQKVNKYTYIDYNVSDESEVFLDAVYDDENFAIEIERLKNIQVENLYYPDLLEDEYKYVKIDNDLRLFNYETYITMYNHNNRYEYACVDYESNRIYYVYLGKITKNWHIKVDKKFLPKNFKQNKNKQTEDKYHYTIYSIYPDYSVDEWL